jgi:hypothetical protein
MPPENGTDAHDRSGKNFHGLAAASLFMMSVMIVYMTIIMYIVKRHLHLEGVEA